MTDQPTTASTADAAPAFDPVRRARELAVLDALRNALQPEAPALDLDFVYGIGGPHIRPRRDLQERRRRRRGHQVEGDGRRAASLTASRHSCWRRTS